ncbi:contractile injection system protein, VgrG/Pvc8 family, partial [Photobacterium sanctipauli]
YYFEHNKNSCTIVFIDNNNCHYCLEKGAKFSLLMAKENVITPDKNTLRVWKNIARVKHNKNTSRKFDYLKPNAPYEVEKVSPLKHLTNKEIYQYPAHNQAQSESELENEIVLQSSTQSEYFIGETASPHLCSGYFIKLEDHPQEC